MEAAVDIATIPVAEQSLRVGAALCCGAAIGLERQWRAKAAGLRTAALVTVGSALFVLMGAYAFPGTDPSRVAAQVASGIGFLGGGVILKEGMSVRGINTAATVWASAAVGTLAGAGLYALAAIGTAAILLANLVLLPLSRMLNAMPTRRGRELEETLYRIEVHCGAPEEPAVRRLLVSALASPDYRLVALHSAGGDGGDLTSPKRIILRAEVETSVPAPDVVEAAVNKLSMEPEVHAVTWRMLRSTESPVIG